MLTFRVLRDAEIPWRDAPQGAVVSGALALPGGGSARARGRWARLGGASLAVLALLPPALAAQTGRVRYGVEGVEGEVRENVVAVLGFARLGRREQVEEERVRRLHGLAVPRTQAALEPFGYYEATVAADLEFREGVWWATYRIDPGPAVHMTRVDLRVSGPGATTPELQGLIDPPPLAVGGPLRHGSYEALKLSLLDVAVARGYLDAAFDSSVIRVNRSAREAEVVLHLSTGPRFQFGPVAFHQDVVDPLLLRGMLPFREGDPFENRSLLELQGALTAGPWFEAAYVRPRRELAEGLRVPVDVDLVPRPAQRFLVGAGYGTDTGPRVTFDFELRRLSRSGHRMSGQVQWALREGRVAAQYEIPWPYPRTEVLTLSAGFTRLSPTTSDSRILTLGAALARSRGRWREAVSLAFQPESWELGDVSGDTRLLLAGLAWSRTWADDRLFPSQGRRLRFEIRGSLEDALSDVSLVQVEVRGWWIQRLASRTRLLLRSEVGGIATDAFSQVPASMRYFAGGDQSIRGYAYRSVGPRDENDNPVGGKILVTGSVEIEQMLLDRWGIAGFVDAGNAISDLPLRPEAGMGAGLRWRSPIGLIRLDGAFAVSQDGTPFRIHLRIGPDL